MRGYLRYAGWLVVLLGSAAAAQDRSMDAASVHWAYSTWFGSGWYRIEEGQDAFVMRYTPVRPLSAPSLDDGNRKAGIELRFPITVGLNHFPLDDLPGSVNPDNLANISVTPAVYLTWPATKRWMLRPFAGLGGGTLLGGSGTAWSYWAGIKSRLVLKPGEPELALVNSLGYVGYSPSDGHSSDFWPVLSALEFRQPIRRDADGAATWQLHAHVAYTFFQDDLDLVGRSQETEPIDDQWEIGLAVGRSDAPISIWRFDFDRLGLAYKFSTNGDLQGIGLIFSSLFDQ